MSVELKDVVVGFLRGSGDPTESGYKQGDFYLDNDISLLYQWDGDTWRTYKRPTGFTVELPEGISITQRLTDECFHAPYGISLFSGDDQAAIPPCMLGDNRDLVIQHNMGVPINNVTVLVYDTIAEIWTQTELDFTSQNDAWIGHDRDFNWTKIHDLFSVIGVRPCIITVNA